MLFSVLGKRMHPLEACIFGQGKEVFIEKNSQLSIFLWNNP